MKHLDRKHKKHIQDLSTEPLKIFDPAHYYTSEPTNRHLFVDDSFRVEFYFRAVN